MVLKPPGVGERIQTVYVNGLDYHSFDKLWRSMTPGKAVVLDRDKGNVHDARAVKVNFAGQQVGWVPKAVNHKIANLLDLGHRLFAVISDAGSSHLEIEVYEVEQKPAPDFVCIEMEEVADRRDDLMDQPYLVVRTSSNRTTADLVGADGVRRGYVYKTREMDALLAKPCRAVRHGRDRLIIMPREMHAKQTATNQTQTEAIKKEITMSLSNKANAIVNTNKSAAAQAAYLEAGRIANNQLVKVSSKALPLMVRGYADTPVGKLVMANIAQIAAQHLRPNDETLEKLTRAMTVAAYQSVIQTVDIEGWLDGLLDSNEIKRAISKLGAAEEAPTEA